MHDIKMLVAKVKTEGYVLKSLLGIIVGLSLVASLGVGYGLGGGENQSTANYINGVIAFAGSLSALGTLCTLYFLIQVRNDWKKPKISDAALDLKLSLRRWLREAELLCESIPDDKNCLLSALDNSKVDLAIESERSSWRELVRLHDKYEFYHGESEELQTQFSALKVNREKLAIYTIKTADPIMRVQFSTFLRGNHILASRLKPELVKACKSVERMIEVRN
ncbi:hypothetical protein ACMAZD_18370 [Vibrio sp. nBUS_14]|uniref:hypothetical protein n=1 Tax=Vibrio sp. nBUS_14 TaxID=3395321 RepID=UPI003EB6AFC5